MNIILLFIRITIIVWISLLSSIIGESWSAQSLISKYLSIIGEIEFHLVLQSRIKESSFWCWSFTSLWSKSFFNGDFLKNLTMDLIFVRMGSTNVGTGRSSRATNCSSSSLLLSEFTELPSRQSIFCSITKNESWTALNKNVTHEDEAWFKFLELTIEIKIMLNYLIHGTQIRPQQLR